MDQDLFTVKKNYGNFDGTPTNTARWSDGDFTNTGMVGAVDLFKVKQNYGTTDTGDGAGVGSSSIAVAPRTLTSSGSAAPADTVQLTVNTTTGDVTMTGNAATLTLYDIGSSHGQLLVAPWQKLTGNPAYTGQGWAVSGTPSTKDLAESSSASNVGAALGTIDLGNIFTVNGLHDLVFQYGTDQNFYDSSSGSNPATGGAVVSYVSSTPEPVALSLLGLGAMGLLARKRRKTPAC